MEKRTVDAAAVKAEALEFVDDRLVGIVCRQEGNSFAVLYFFDRDGKKSAIETVVPAKEPLIPTIIEVFENAEHYEREIHEQFGIVFEGNPRLHQKFLLPDDWPDGDYPMRKNKPNLCRGDGHA